MKVDNFYNFLFAFYTSSSFGNWVYYRHRFFLLWADLRSQLRQEIRFFFKSCLPCRCVHLPKNNLLSDLNILSMSMSRRGRTTSVPFSAKIGFPLSVYHSPFSLFRNKYIQTSKFQLQGHLVEHGLNIPVNSILRQNLCDRHPTSNKWHSIPDRSNQKHCHWNTSQPINFQYPDRAMPESSELYKGIFSLKNVLLKCFPNLM